jgi:aerobic-type carbon monoxide dehydrogenase small subunit (CoxS/CutS family)
LKHSIVLDVNGRRHPVDVESDDLLVDVLRNRLGLTGTKKGCGTGDCGACTVIMAGRVVNSCLVLAVGAADKPITTIEGLGGDGQLHPLQRIFVERGAVQCGYCTPGMIMMAKALLDENPHPTEEDVRIGMAGNLCRCTGYTKIVEAILAAADEMNGGR